MIGERYTVKQGDTLWGIARKTLGSGDQWPRIWRYNNRYEVIRVTGKGIPDPDSIRVGQVLLIPVAPYGPRDASTGPAELPLKGVHHAHPAAKGPHSVELSKSSRSVVLKYSLNDIVVPPISSPYMTIEVKMSGDIILSSREQYPVSFNLNRGEMDMHAVSQANFDFGSLISDMDLAFDAKTNNLALKCMLVTKSHCPNTWATAVGVVVDSSNLKPKIRYEFRAPELKGDLPFHTYIGLNVKIVVDVSASEQDRIKKKELEKTAESPNYSVDWKKVGEVAGLTIGVIVGIIVAIITRGRIQKVPTWTASVTGQNVGDFFPMGRDSSLVNARIGQGFNMVPKSRLPAASHPAIVKMNIKISVTNT